MSINTSSIRRQFHFFRSHPDAVYFDNASTTQKPDRVIEAMDPCWTCAANVGRSAHSLASRMTRGVEATRERVAAFLGASSVSEIVFTSGATHSLNLAALGWGLANLLDGDEVLYCPQDHKSAVLPWLNLRDILGRFGVKIRLIPFGVTYAGDGDIDDLLSKVTPRTRAIALTHIHNAYGTKTDVERVRPAVGPDLVLSLDAAQSVGHLPVDVRALGVDFLAFSGHKMFAATGTGGLWVHPRLHDAIHPPFDGGSGSAVAGDILVRAPMPQRLEPGTPNIAGILSLGAAVDLIEELTPEAIHDRLRSLTLRLVAGLRTVPGVEFLPGPAMCRCAVGYGTVSFRLREHPANEVGFILDQQGISVRTGNHCRADDAAGDTIRASVQIYNTEKEVDRFIEAVAAIG